MESAKVTGKWLSARLARLQLKYVLIFALVNILFLMLMKTFVVKLALFTVCAIVIYRFGRLPFGDFDPFPVAAGLLLLWYGFSTALQFILWTIPLVDIIAARLSQWSAVNFFSLSAALAVVSLLNPNPVSALILIVVLFNLIRLPITLLLGGGPNSFIPASTNSLFYLIVLSLMTPIIEISLKLF
ncbi:MAG: hypothetical protein HGA85_05220 [Nanoarchaeota archaeon]|nr:hypothetical protein [Nanoarchaeota archaeon]